MPLTGGVRPDFRRSKRSLDLALSGIAALVYSWTYTRNFWRRRKKRDPRESLPQADTSAVASEDSRPREHIVRPSQDITHTNRSTPHFEKDTSCPKDTIVSEEAISRIQEEIARPEDKVSGLRGERRLVKWMSIFKHPGSAEFVNRRVLLDSGSTKNMISEEALEQIECVWRRSNGGVKIGGLFNSVFHSNETVRLEFRFWDQLERFEEEFLVLPKLEFAGFQGPGFDCLLCWDWMSHHQSAWVPTLKDA